MNLKNLRDEVIGHGFDQTQYGARITQYLNDAQLKIASECDFYVDEAISLFSTVVGTDTYSWPARLAEIRSIFDTTRRIELQYASLRSMDRSTASNGAPLWWAITGPNVRLYPVPDNVYPLEMRYWALPATLVNDTDIPSLPEQWHPLLWTFACWMCFESDDDDRLGQYWEGRWNREFSAMKADLKFPTTDGPSQAGSMWNDPQTLSSQGGWIFGGLGY